MLNTVLSDFYERDIRKLIDEVNLFQNEEDMWRTSGSIKNCAGNLALHIIGGSNYLFGTILTGTGYVRNRDQEFMIKGVSRQELVRHLEALISLITKAVNEVNMNAEYPLVFDGEKRSNTYVLTQLLLHLNYHLGQVNYLRRMLESQHGE